MDTQEIELLLAYIRSERRIDSIFESERLEETLRKLIREGRMRETPVEFPENAMQEEHWYLDLVSGQTYKYVPANFPARGYWGRISRE